MSREKLKATLLAGAAASVLAPASVGAQEAKSAPVQELREIVVTATKRATKLVETPISMTVLGSDEIDTRNLQEMQDYLNAVPGVTMQDLSGQGAGNSIVIRGIAVDVQSTTDKQAIATYFGEVPTARNGGGFVDLKMVDIERVEVLRGPQGTLFGSGSMGGTLRIIPKAPDLNDFEGMIGSGYSHTGGHGGGNTEFKGVVNIPLIQDKMAFRAVGYRYDTSGYVQNLAASYTGPFQVRDAAANWGGAAVDDDSQGAQTVSGARASLLVHPADGLDITLSYAWQKSDNDGTGLIFGFLPDKYSTIWTHPGDTVARYHTFKPGLDLGGTFASETAHIGNLTIEYDAGWGQFISATSYVDINRTSAYDGTYYLQSILGMFGIGYNYRSKQFSQEVRFASSFDGPFQILAGAYYEHLPYTENSGDFFTGSAARQQASLELLNSILGWNIAPFPAYMGHFNYDYTGNQTALFGEVSYDILDNLKITVGARHYDYDRTEYAIDVSPSPSNFGTVDAPFVNRDNVSKNKGETYKAGIEWRPDENKFLYFTWSEGFRPGQFVLKPPLEFYDPTNSGFYTAEDGSQIPITDGLAPDTLQNYEIGFKGTFAGGRIALSAAAYHIDWKGLPVTVGIRNIVSPPATTGVRLNAGKAVVDGFELEGRFRLMEALTLDLGGSYNVAKLDGDSSLGASGTKLPGSADYQITAGLQYDFALAGYDGFIRGDYSYQSEFKSKIAEPDDALKAGGYGMLNMSAGMTFNDFSVNVFVKNLTNQDDITWLQSANYPSYYRLRPRTAGFNVAYRF
ncbi:MAG: TonB-dependent receptor [Sphingobium sp.]